MDDSFFSQTKKGVIWNADDILWLVIKAYGVLHSNF